MQDTPKEAATGDKAARDLMLSEKKYIIGANRAGKSTFFTNIQNFFEIQKKEIEKLQTELIKERAVNANLLRVMRAIQHNGRIVGMVGFTEWATEAADLAIKQAEEL